MFQTSTSGRPKPSITFQTSAAGNGKKAGTFAILLVALLTASGCSGPSGSDVRQAFDEAALSSASQSIDALRAGNYEEPPSEAPTPVKDANIWIVSCGQMSAGCAGISAGAQEAASSLGWEANLCDGKLDPGAMSACVRSAITAGADSVVLAGIDCQAIQQPLLEARTAGVETVGVLAFDCDSSGGEPLFSASTKFTTQYPTLKEWADASGRARADWVIDATSGNAKAITLFALSSTITTVQNDAFVKRIQECSSCSVSEGVALSDGDLGGGQVRAKFESALLKSPEANAVATPADTFFLLGLETAITGSGKSDSLHTIGGEGNGQNLDFIAKNQGEDATLAVANGWLGYAAVDTAIRVLAGQPGVTQGIGFQLVDKDNVADVTLAGHYNPPVDYIAAYRKAWGLQ
ncbi:substrate-binding domain-containing protein [Arthrobacter sp. Cr_A7]|uniref:sugar ABC transporter substrate-binding protein n=1 Tax=Arthrobacter sp. Cr_A7 TaxID=3031017 RepID=UPI0023DA2EB7|nr:substrate-binding domain-containing protein [Arthrobacter sp. Cr_A7]MDF2052231.1 substrate-binding domain-containing protein [Arthrobacter sp. Cr_A7]